MIVFRIDPDPSLWRVKFGVAQLLQHSFRIIRPAARERPHRQMNLKIGSFRGRRYRNIRAIFALEIFHETTGGG